MKKKINLTLRFSILMLVFMSCKKIEIKETQNLSNLIFTTNKTTTKFSGSFFGFNNAKEIYITLNSLQNENKITGTLLMDGEKAKIIATEINGICSGKITENSDKTYLITIKFIDDKLYFAITFPEYDNQVLTLILSKTKEKLPTVIAKKNVEKNTKLIGTWRFTEVLSSGSGEFYTSFSTDYFLQLKSDGQCITWTGNSAGGNNDIGLEDNGKSNIEVAQWHTDGKNIVFTNPTTNKKMSIAFYAEENRMILKGNLNRVYIRIK